MFLFNDQGACLAAKLRPGNVAPTTATICSSPKLNVEGKHVAFRADAAFAKSEVYEALEARGVAYAILIPANRNLELAIEDLLFRPRGRPSRRPLVRYKSFSYQAATWISPRRVIAKVEHHTGELFLRVGFIVTNLTLSSRSVAVLQPARDRGA